MAVSKDILDIEKYVGDTATHPPRNRIYRIGVELEGGWSFLDDKVRLVHDGSVTNLKTADTPSLRCGELPSPPKLPVQMWAWMRKYYPTHINESCGMHVHMSFKLASHYSSLMTIEYQNTMIEYLSRWGRGMNFPDTHPIWPRLAGKNKYCQLKFWPDKQAVVHRKDYNQDKPGHRYTAINYCHGLNGNGTLEVRVLPMMDTVDQAISAVKCVLDVTNASLVALARKNKKIADSFSVIDSYGSKGVTEHSIELV